MVMSDQGVITEPARETAVLATADVIVVGSGPAGLAAALGAARAAQNRAGGIGVVAVGHEGAAGSAEHEPRRDKHEPC